MAKPTLRPVIRPKSERPFVTEAVTDKTPGTKIRKSGPDGERKPRAERKARNETNYDDRPGKSAETFPSEP